MVITSKHIKDNAVYGINTKNIVFPKFNFETATIKWWERVILFFLKTYHHIDWENSRSIDFKRFRGKLYLVSDRDLYEGFKRQ